MLIPDPKKPAKVSAATIVGFTHRRSRSEGTLAHMQGVSYPHHVIGNIVDLLSLGKEADLRRAVNTERDLVLLEYIRGIALTVNQGKVSFQCYSAKLDPGVTKTKALAQEAQGCFDYHGGSLQNISEVLESLLVYFHATQVRGRTRKYPLTTGRWYVQSSSLKVDKDQGLAGLKREVHTQELPLASIHQWLLAMTAQDHLGITFGPEAILVTDSEGTSTITYQA